MRAVLAACLLVGCAQGRTNGGSVDASEEPSGGRVDSGGQPSTADAKEELPDAPVTPDAPPAVVPDAMVTPDAPPAAVPDAMVMVDAPPSAVPDAMMTPDAPPSAVPDAHVVVCTDQQLLLNPVLDLNPAGTKWSSDPIDSSYPIVTGDGSPSEDTAPYKAWLGGFTGDDYGVFSVNDELHQDVVVPPNTTQLRLTAKYAVGTEETTSSSAYDTSQVALTQTNGTPIQVIANFSNLSKTNGWAAIDQTVMNATLSGQTVRLRITSSHDSTLATSFFYDSFQLFATVCE